MKKQHTLEELVNLTDKQFVTHANALNKAMINRTLTTAQRAALVQYRRLVNDAHRIRMDMCA